MKKAQIASFLAGLSIIGLGGCGDDSNQSVVDLVKSDIQAFDTMDTSGHQEVDQNTNGAFTKVFGGTDGASLKQYFSERVHYILDDNTKISVSPNKFKFDSWISEPESERTPTEKGTEEKIQMLAANISPLYWFQGLLDRVQVTVSSDQQQIPISSSRTGIMLVGSGYRDATRYPISFRQAVILHEARHSDCTGGLSEDDLEFARHSPSYHKFTEDPKRVSCGHFHVYCPDTSDYAGVPMCDANPWEAYSVSAIYTMAHTLSATDEKERNILAALALDQLGRLQFDAKAMLHGALGDPDMTSVADVRPADKTKQDGSLADKGKDKKDQKDKDQEEDLAK